MALVSVDVYFVCIVTLRILVVSCNLDSVSIAAFVCAVYFLLYSPTVFVWWVVLATTTKNEEEYFPWFEGFKNQFAVDWCCVVSVCLSLFSVRLMKFHWFVLPFARLFRCWFFFSSSSLYLCNGDSVNLKNVLV